MVGDRYHVTLIADVDGVHWDLRSGLPSETSVRIEDGVAHDQDSIAVFGAAHTWAAALHQAGTALQRWSDARLADRLRQ